MRVITAVALVALEEVSSFLLTVVTTVLVVVATAGNNPRSNGSRTCSQLQHSSHRVSASSNSRTNA